MTRGQAEMELVTGATGYVGGHLVERLLAEGRAVRAAARDESALAPLPGAERVTVDLVTGRGLERALEGCRTAYYLVHSMDGPRPLRATDDGNFASRDRRAADNFARAAAAAGVERVVYLGGIMPAEGAVSAHLRSRVEVERTLLEAVPRSTALRASILIGAHSSSFRILVRLVERLRVLPLPAWRENRTQPIDERDAIEYLARTPGVEEAAGRSLDIAGPDVVSYARMIERIGEQMGVGRAPLGLGVTVTPVTSAVVSAITDQPLGLVRPLMESLQTDLLPRDGAARDLYGIRLRPFARAVERALRVWEASEPLAAR
ncbi:MAG: NAD(P)H-binding protein [Thermoleophilaceae bacterium]